MRGLGERIAVNNDDAFCNGYPENRLVVFDTLQHDRYKRDYNTVPLLPIGN